MKKYAFIAFLFSSSSLAIENQLSICTKDDDLRAIEIFYLTEERVPCEVNYTKDSIDKILWRAQSDEGYCEAKAADFVNNLKKWGWNCKSVLGEPKQ